MRSDRLFGESISGINHFARDDILWTWISWPSPVVPRRCPTNWHDTLCVTAMMTATRQRERQRVFDSSNKALLSDTSQKDTEYTGSSVPLVLNSTLILVPILYTRAYLDLLWWQLLKFQGCWSSETTPSEQKSLSLLSHYTDISSYTSTDIVSLFHFITVNVLLLTCRFCLR